MFLSSYRASQILTLFGDTATTPVPFALIAVNARYYEMVGAQNYYSTSQNIR